MHKFSKISSNSPSLHTSAGISSKPTTFPFCMLLVDYFNSSIVNDLF